MEFDDADRNSWKQETEHDAEALKLSWSSVEQMLACIAVNGNETKRQ